MAGLPRPIKPTLIRPMLVSLRHELPADEESYGWELKWDGLRAIAYVSGDTVRLVSRNDKGHGAELSGARRARGAGQHPGDPGRGDRGAARRTPGLRPAAVAHARPLDSAYHPGQRRDWIKIKNVKQQEVIICGWKPGEGRRADTIGSLLVGIYDGDQLRYAGHVGTGFTQDMLTDLMGQLGSLGREESPFGTKIPDLQARGARWVEPRLVGEVAFAEWTTDGILRQPSWRGLRIDKEPGEVHRED